MIDPHPANTPGTPADALVWFRRDLRTHDHAALSAALAAHPRVWCVFVFDTDILDALPSRVDRRVAFIHACVESIDRRLRQSGGGLIVEHGSARVLIAQCAERLGIGTVYANHDDEPASLDRDRAVEASLHASGRRLVTLKDHVIFERREVMTAAGSPFSVFTPYKKAWLARLASHPSATAAHPVDMASGQLRAAPIHGPIPELRELGFESPLLEGLPVTGSTEAAQSLLEAFVPRMGQYGERRDFPALRGPSYLSMHLRFGTISVRELVRLALSVSAHDPAASAGAHVWLGELIWRDFYAQILAHHPHVVTRCFKPAFDRIVWEQGPVAQAHFQAWCEGRTGYPLVDAAQRQLLQSGYMHNRLRMVSASFLVKDLGIDWRLGEAWFARHLNDFDLASNNGGWQWAASTGCDAQPWFRIFNPVTQSRKFDPQGRFIRRYCPEWAGLDDDSIHAPWLAARSPSGGPGPRPIVDHALARQKTLERFGVVKQAGEAQPADFSAD